MLRYIPIFFVFLIALNPAQAQNVTFEKALNTSQSGYFNCVLQTNDLGFIFAGNYSDGAYMIQTNQLGDTIWTNKLDTYGYSDFNSIVASSDDEFVLVGQQYINLWIVKINIAGDTLWTKQYDLHTTDEWSKTIGSSVTKSLTGGYIITGLTNLRERWPPGSGWLGDMFIMKIDEDGDILWTKYYSDGELYAGICILESQSNQILVGGGIDRKAFIMVCDSSGDSLWVNKYNTSTCNDIVSDLMGNFVFTSQNKLIKTNISGDTLWTKDYSNMGGENGNRIDKVGNDGYIIVGNVRDWNNNNYDVSLIRIDSNGDKLWTRAIGIEEDVGYGGREFGNDVISTFDGGFVFTGYTNSFSSTANDYYLVKTNEFGLISQAEVDTSERNFGNVIFGSQNNIEIEISNTNPSYGDLFIHGIEIAGNHPENFILQNLEFPLVLAPGANEHINVFFNPAATGLKDADFLIETNDTNNRNITIPVKGNSIIDINTTVVPSLTNDQSIDLVLICDRPIERSPIVKISQNNDFSTVAISSINNSKQIFKGSYEFGESGNYNISTQIIKKPNIDYIAERNIAIGLIEPQKSGVITSFDTIAKLYFPESNNSSQIMVIAESFSSDSETSYKFSSNSIIKEKLLLEIELDGNNFSAKDNLSIYGKDENEWLPIQSSVTELTNKISAQITDLGQFKVGITQPSVLSEKFPDEYLLMQNYPNPFNPITTIEYQIPKLSQVDLNIYNLLGQKVATLVSVKQPAGSYKLEWDASGFESGIYFYKLETNQGFVITKKLIFLK